MIRRAKNWASWLIDSNYLRLIDDEEFMSQSWIKTDLENVSSPGTDPKSPLDVQHKLIMGRSVPLSDYSELPGPEGEKRHRRPFNAFETGHEFFADYQPHNMGVFSFFDDLRGMVDEVLDYLVIGFHSTAVDDPLAVFDSLPTTTGGKNPLKYEELVKTLSLVLGRDAGPSSTFLDTIAGTQGRTLTHGVLRSVQWNRVLSPLSAPSVELQQQVYMHQPVAVGINTMDALAAFLHVSLSAEDSAAPVHTLLGQLVMLIARDDDVDSQRKAADEVAAMRGWIAQSQGTLWQLPEQDDKGAAPLPGVLTLLTTLNQRQQQLDTVIREYNHLAQRLFGCWWNAIGLRRFSPEVHKERRLRVKTEAGQIVDRMAELTLSRAPIKDALDLAKSQLTTALGGKTPSATAAPAFGRRQDPTVLFAGAKSGWPAGFAGPLGVRIASDVAPVVPGKDYSWIDSIPLPRAISEPARALLREFDEPDASKRGGKPNPYAEMEDTHKTQGWFPLFIEWEVEYYQIPFDKWTFEADEASGEWRYAIAPEEELAQSLASKRIDFRTFGDRTAIAPEAATTLQARLGQLMSRESDKKTLAMGDRVKDALAGLEYFTSPLGGFADHLLTLRRGHIPRPVPGDKAVQEALGVSADSLVIVEKMTHEVAPYGATTPLPADYTSYSPFKPVAHGQFRFTKLVLVDKFGQVVSVIQPGDNGEGSSAVYPCVSPAMACNPREGKTADYYPNTAIEADRKANVCQFVQVPPRINQQSRLNTRFLRPLEDVAASVPRQAAGDWDSPIWAWLVVNYQNYSIQVFNGTGEFVVEVLLDEGKSTARFSQGPDDGHTAPAKGRLAALVVELARYEFSHGLFAIMSGASDSVSISSSGFDGMLPAAFGRPFCIADLGVSIELATPPLTDASLLTSPAADREAEPGLLDYEFPVALGNYTAAFDGLVGTFAASGAIGHIQSAYRTSSSADTGDTGGGGDDAGYLKVRPYFVPGETADLAPAHDAQLARACVSAILDPVCPVHVYSGALFPLGELAPARWAVDQAMRNMHVFFAVGPTLVPALPRTDLVHIQAPKTTATAAEGVMSAEAAAGPEVQMPTGGTSADAWQWLHPAMEAGKTRWDPVAIRSVDKALKVEAAANSAIVEGYVLVKAGTSG